MENALSSGAPILVQNVGEVLDPSIAPILDKAIVTIGSAQVIKFNDKMVTYNNNFRMYLTTKLGEFILLLACLAYDFIVVLNLKPSIAGHSFGLTERYIIPIFS